jgi:Catalytic LigB subunit of aromatic ring-opening dioxygenase
MPLVFAAATSHAPGITAWNEAAPAPQRASVAAAFETLNANFERALPDVVLLLTSEHWTNFFLDHVGAFCVGRGDEFRGPVEPWLGVPSSIVPGAPALAGALVDGAYDDGYEVSFGYELEFDHGSMVPLHFLTPAMNVPVVPVFFNTLATPQPSARRCLGLGRSFGEVVARWPQRVAIVATGGMSHDPGERGHGRIDSDFDRTFLARMASGNVTELAAYSNADFAAAGAGAFELLAWIALRGAIGDAPGRVLGYEAVVPWATGIGFMTFDLAVPAVASAA